MLDRITRFNNTQNAMKLSDFRSNDPVQISLVNYINEIPAFGGRKYTYRNKRTQAGDRSKIAIRLDDFCRAVYAYQFGPTDCFGGQSHLYDTGKEGGYVRLFGKELEPLPQSEFDRLFGIWLVTSFVTEQLRKERTTTDDLDDLDRLRAVALERKYLTFFALGEVIREVCKLRNLDEALVLSLFGKPRWQDDDKKIAFIEEAFSLACDMVVYAYQLAQAKDSNFVHRNFFRDPETLTSIRSAKAAQRSQMKKLAERAPLNPQAAAA
jgi:hypothetical protein